MDNAILVDELRDVIRDIKNDMMHIALFMLVGTDAESREPWNLIVSAVEYDKISIKDALEHLLNIVRNNVSKNHLSSLVRATILKTNDPFVISINKGFNVKKSTVTLQNTSIFGIYIESAIILESNMLKINENTAING